jgi:hypothetical protein
VVFSPPPSPAPPSPSPPLPPAPPPPVFGFPGAGWTTILVGLSYCGTCSIPQNGYMSTLAGGSFSEIRVVRASGFISCACSTSGGFPNPDPLSRWQTCPDYGSNPTPFELNVNGNQLISMPAWQGLPSGCSVGSSSYLYLNCVGPFAFAPGSSAAGSWQEGRTGISIGDNCGTIYVNVFAR